MAKVLWIDNDPVSLGPYERRLRAAGYEVIRVHHLGKAERLLEEDDWDILIIDPMMNVTEDEEKDYLPSETDDGLKAGLIFFKRKRSRIGEMRAMPLVFTMRGDREIVDDFVSLGVKEDAVKNKLDVSDSADFVEWVKDMAKRRAK